MDPSEFIESTPPRASPRSRSRLPRAAWVSAALAETPAHSGSAVSSAPWAMQPTMYVESSRCSSESYTTGGMVEAARNNLTNASMLLCACRRPLEKKTSHTACNPEREFFICARRGKEANSYHTWIWVDFV